MSSRLVSTALPRCTVTTITTARHSNTPKLQHVNGNTTHYATLDNSTLETSTQVLSSPSLALAKSLSQQTMTSKPALSSFRRPKHVFTKAFKESRKVDELTRGFEPGEQHGKVARAWEPVERELWLERFGGPSRTIERVSGDGRVVLRDAAPDGKGYLRILI